MILSNTSLGVVQDQVRQNALRSFEFYANSVLSCQLDEDLCMAVQDIVQDRVDVLIQSDRPRALALALSGWLITQGMAVLTAAQLPTCEILRWLDLEKVSVERPSEGVTLDLQSNGVRIQWL